MARSSRKFGFMTAMSCVFALIIVLAAVAFITPSPALQSVALGAIGSLVAAILFTALADKVDTPFTRMLESLDHSVESVQRIEADARRRLEAGVVGVTDKYADDANFWLDILRSATNKLDMVGLSFGGWEYDPYEQELKTHITRILRDGGRVRIIVMNPTGERCPVASQLYEKNYCERTAAFAQTIEAGLREFAKSGQLGDFSLRLSDDALTYMMIDAGRDVYVSPYLSVTKAQHAVVAQIADRSGFAAGYRADFDKLFRRAVPSKSLETTSTV